MLALSQVCSFFKITAINFCKWEFNSAPDMLAHVLELEMIGFQGQIQFTMMGSTLWRDYPLPSYGR